MLNSWKIPFEPDVVRYRSADVGPAPIPLQVPFITTVDRLTFVVRGTMQMTVNMHSVVLQDNMLVYTAKGTLVLIGDESRDLELYSCNLSVKPHGQIHPHHRVFEADDTLAQRMSHYFEALLSLGCNVPAVTGPLHSAMLGDLFASSHVVRSFQNVTRSQSTFNAFIELVAEHAIAHRDVAFYAGRLNLSPSRLMAVVKQCSQHTVLQWINMRTVMQAKALLAYSDKTVAEVAYELGIDDTNYFSRFFRHETGVTPSEYRASTR